MRAINYYDYSDDMKQKHWKKSEITPFITFLVSFWLMLDSVMDNKLQGAMSLTATLIFSIDKLYAVVWVVE